MHNPLGPFTDVLCDVSEGIKNKPDTPRKPKGGFERNLLVLNPERTPALELKLCAPFAVGCWAMGEAMDDAMRAESHTNGAATSDFAIDISHDAEPPTSHLVLSEAQDHHWKIRLPDASKLHLRPDGKTNGK